MSSVCRLSMPNTPGGTLKITVNAEQPKDEKLSAQVTVPASDVDEAVAKTYKDISHKYNFQGFRKGHTPRPVIDGMVGRDAVLAQATDEVLRAAEPMLLEELDLVPVGDVDYGEAKPVEEGVEYVFTAVVPLRPEADLESYDEVEIEMPPATATDSEISGQLEMLQSYHISYEDVEEDRGVEKGDYANCDIEDVKGAADIAGANRMIAVGDEGVPEEFTNALLGMKKGETKEISFSFSDEEEPVTCKVTVKAIRTKVTPELTDEFVSKGFGFPTLGDLKDAIREEIEDDKKSSLPSLKENRSIEKLASRLKLEAVPEGYANQVFSELAQQFLSQLQQQGMTLDGFLAQQRIGAEEFLNDLHVQADERARQSLALDALAKKLGIEVTDDDIDEEFKAAGAPDVADARKSFVEQGRMPAIRESIKRTKALKWLVDNAKVTEVDEAAKKAEETSDEEEKPADKKSTKAAAKKVPAKKKAAPEADAE